ncbi:SDR family oxidoreductase [Streptomyces sp. M19]
MTGAGQGIGAAYGRRLLDEGATVVLADRNGEAVRDLARHHPDRALAVTVDVSDPQSNRQLADTLTNRFGHLDGLVNNAAIFSTLTMRPFWEIEEREWDEVLSVNQVGGGEPPRERLCCAVASQRSSKARSRSVHEATWTGKAQLRHGPRRQLPSPGLRRSPTVARGSLRLGHPRRAESVTPHESSPMRKPPNRVHTRHPQPRRDACPILLCTHSAS